MSAHGSFLRRSTIALCALASCSIVVPATAESPSYYSTKQAYSPQGSEYSSAPAGFSQIHTQSVDRHGSRGLSGFKYDDLAQQMLDAARETNSLTNLGTALIPQVEAMITVNRELQGGFGQSAGYGNLSSVGRDELRTIGQRNAERNADLLETIDKQNLSMSFLSSGQDRAIDSGWNFGEGVLSDNDALKDNVSYDAAAGHIDIDTRTDLLYAHKDKESPRYSAYQDWAKSDVLKDKVQSAYSQPASRTAARDLLEHIFRADFIDSIDSGAISFTAREDEDEEVTGIVDAALQFYNLYVISPALANEQATPEGGWVFEQFMDPQNGPVFAYLLDIEDYYEKGPAIAGETVAYDNYEPLLLEMLASVQRRAQGGTVAADYRFAHAEALIPLAALLKTPGSEKGVPEPEVMSYENSTWRGDQVSPMAANIQWDSFSNEDGRVIVRMLYNEKEIPFTDGCVPISDGSSFYTLDELQACLPLGAESDHSLARIQQNTETSSSHFPALSSSSS